MQINKLMALVDEGVGPILAVTVVLLSIRLAFLLFTNFSVALNMFSGKMPPASNFVILFPRTLLENATLASLANAGQSLKNEVTLFMKNAFNQLLNKIAGNKEPTLTGQNSYFK